MSREYVGGYADWLRQRPNLVEADRPQGPPLRKPAGSGPRKTSYREQQELLALPGRIERLEAEQEALRAAVAGPRFDKEPAATIAATMARLVAVDQELLEALARWDDLDSLTKR